MDPDKKVGDQQRPYSPPKDEPAEKPDAEKFKKTIMKVSETEDAEKKKKRNLPKGEEEGDEEEVEDTPPQAPTSNSFQELMSDKDELGNVFDKESGGVRQKMTPDENSPFTAPPQGSISTEGVESEQGTPPPQTGQDFSAQPPAQSPPDENAAQQPPPAAEPPQEPPSSGYQQQGETWGGQPPAQEPSENVPYYEGGFEETPPQQPNQPQQQQGTTPNGEEQPTTTPSNQVDQPTPKEQSGEQGAPKKKEDDSSLLASQPKKSELGAFKKQTPKGAVPEEKLTPGVQTPQVKEGEQPQKLEEGLAPPEKEKKELPPTMEEGLTGASETGKTPAKTVPTGEELPTGKTEEEPIKQGVFPKETEAPLKEAPKGPSPFQRFTPQQVRNQKMGKEGEAAASIEGLPVPTSTEGGKGEMGQGKKDEDTHFIEADSNTAGIPLPSFDNPVLATAPTAETPAYSKLSPEVHELFEKMGGVMTILQDKGITTTTMNINMPGSVFNGAQVILEQYSTAPNAFNIQLVGNPESVKVFSQNLEALENSFKQGNFNFEANLLNPILTTGRKSPHLIRRKGSAGGKGGKGGKRGD